MNKKGKYLKYLSIFPVLFLLTSCDSSALGDSLSENIVSKIIPNIWAFLVQLLALIVLIIIVIKFAYKPVRKYLDKRKELLETEKNEAQEMNLKAKENLYESEKKLAEVRGNAAKIIDDAKIQAKEESIKIIDEANKEASKIKINAEKNIEEAKQKAKKELKDEIVDVAFSASSKILEREINKDDTKHIVDNFVKDIDSLKDK